MNYKFFLILSIVLLVVSVATAIFAFSTDAGISYPLRTASVVLIILFTTMLITVLIKMNK